jgi:hypothetical protein
MERLRGKIKEVIADDVVTAEPKKKYAKSPKSLSTTDTRPLDILIREFKASSGSFEEFHCKMNGREKILLKGYIDSMRNSEL